MGTTFWLIFIPLIYFLIGFIGVIVFKHVDEEKLKIQDVDEESFKIQSKPIKILLRLFILILWPIYFVIILLRVIYILLRVFWFIIVD